MFSMKINKEVDVIQQLQELGIKVDKNTKLIEVINQLNSIGEDIFPLSGILKTTYKDLKNFTEVKKISPTLLAEYIIYKRCVERKPINNNELNAMLKIINDLYKQSIDKELLDTEVVFSGIYPKYTEVYYKYSKYGVLPIIFDFDINKLAKKELEEEIGKNNVKVINGILKKYSEYDLYELIEVINQLSKLL